ncbi:MAG: TonB-dependent receptor [Gemmatimonadetes bacterium]|nr:TonB-dependent receptor [Gemmatimonadota bacterium]
MKRLITSVLVLTCLVAAPLSAQTDQTGVLEGTVQDVAGGAIALADVRIALEDGSYPQATLSDATGAFRLGFLKPGAYVLRVRAIGFRPVELTNVRIRAGRVTTLTVVSNAAPVELEPIVVLAARPLIDRTTTEFTTTLESEVLDMLPASRTAVELIEFIPGARPDQVWGGSTAQANAYQLDGVNVNAPGLGGEFLLPNVDWLEEITVKGLGSGAEYGGFQGGLINMVTKSGSNTFRGDVRFNFANQSLNASNVNAFEAGDEQDGRWEINASVSGAIVRDKLYYFLSGQSVQTDTRVVDVENATPDNVVFLTGPSGEPLLREEEQRKFLAKLTWQATPNDIFNGMFGTDDVFTDNVGLNSFDSPETALKLESPAAFYNVSWQRIWNANHLTELKVTGYNGRLDQLPLNGTLPNVRLLSGNEASFRNEPFTRLRDPDVLTITGNWDSYWNTGSVRHHLKVGGDYRLGWWDESRIRNSGISWRPDDDGAVFDPEDPGTWDFISSDWGGHINLRARSVNAAAYVQDYISLTSRLRVNPGLRVGVFRGRLTPGDSVGSAFTAVDDVALAPRLGASFDLLEGGGLVAKAHWGRYYQDMFALMFDRTEGGNVFTDLEFWDWIDASLPDINREYSLAERDQFFDFFGGVQIGQEVGPVENFSQPYMNQFVGGLEWEFAPGWKAGAVYVNRRNKNIIALVDRNLATNYTEFNNIEVFEFPSGDPVLDANGNALVLPRLLVSNDDIMFVGGAPGLSAAQVAALTYEEDLALTVAPDAVRKMDQIQVSVERAFDDWSALGSLVWTDLRGNFFSVNGYDNPIGIGAGAFVHPNEQTNFNGDLRNASTWEAKLRVTGNLPQDFRVGGFLTYRSGDHYTPTFTIDRRNLDFVSPAGFLDPDLIFGIDGETIFLEERGSRTHDEQFRLDLHVDKIFRLGRADLVVALDVFNTFNSGAVLSLKTSVNNQIPGEATTLFGAPRFRVVPRNLRLTSSLRFF